MNRLDYKLLNQKYSLGEFRPIPEYTALTDCDAELKEKVQDVLFYLLNSIDIDKCSGFLLDNIARLVGTDRTYFDISPYFKINSPDVNESKYIWFSNVDSVYTVPAGTLSDSNLRNRVKAKAGKNTSRCTREDNIQIIKNMFFADSVKITNVAPMMLDIEITGENLFVTQTPRADIESILGNGVGINNLTIGAS